MDDEEINPFAEESGPTVVIDNGGERTPTTSRDQPPPLPTKHPLPSVTMAPTQPNEFCCSRSRWLHSGEDTEIQIIDAQKTSEGSNASYIAYVIRTGSMDTRRRYSEFESLRNSLIRLHPTLIVPPIPSKTSLGDYAVKQGKAKEDLNMISRRRRLLTSFLNRVARHPILSNDHVFHRFLQNDVSWNEVLHSPPISALPKNLLKAPSHAPTDDSYAQMYAVLPTPSASQPLRNPDQRFLDSEAFTEKFVGHMSGPMERVTRRTMKRWSEYAQDHADLGAALNGFSLNEEGSLAAAIEKTGQAIDATYLSTSILLQELESSWAEPLHEYTQFAEIIRKLLLYRHQKHAQYEMTISSIESKREQVEEYERVEAAARRLETALANGRRVRPPGAMGGASQSNADHDPQRQQASATDGSPEGEAIDGTEAKEEPEQEQDDADLPPYSPPVPPPKRRASGLGLLNALSYTIQGMMDVDPETARRNSMTKTKETLAQLEESLHMSTQDLKYASSTIQADLDRFQRQKVADIRDMAIALARSHRDYCKKNLEVWEEVKKEVANIELHPNDVAAGGRPIDPQPTSSPNM